MEEIFWDAPEYEDHERGIEWHGIVIIVAIVLIGVAFWQKNFLFGVLVVLGTATLFLWNRHSSPVHTIRLRERMIHIGPQLSFHVDEFMGFAIEHGRHHDPEWGKLHLRSKHRLRPYVTITIPRGKFDVVRSHLLQHIAELEHDPSLTDALIRYFKL